VVRRARAKIIEGWYPIKTRVTASTHHHRQPLAGHYRDNGTGDAAKAALSLTARRPGRRYPYLGESRWHYVLLGRPHVSKRGSFFRYLRLGRSRQKQRH
jgi:hypothetical protein